MQGALFQWLRKKPQPVSLRIRNADDDTSIIEINPTSSQRWKMALEAIKAARAVTVECLDKKGNILRARELEAEPGDASSEEQARRDYERKMGGERKDMALMLDRYGDRLNEAFERGADAAAKSHEALVALVGTLTQQLNAAIVNIHTISMNYARTLEQAAGVENGSSGNEALLASVVAAALNKSGSGAKKDD